MNINQHQNLEDALGGQDRGDEGDRGSRETVETVETGKTGDTELTGPTLLRHGLIEISPKMGKISTNS